MKFKVVHVLHSVGGVEVYLRLLSNNIDNEKIEFVIIQQEDSNRPVFTYKDGKQIVDYKIPIQREINLFKDVLCVIKTIKILFKEKPNVIHAHSAKGGIIARVASLFYNVPVLHTPHAYSYLSAESEIKRKLFLFIERVFRRINSFLLATSDSERQRGIENVGYKKEKTFVFHNSIKPIEEILELEDLKKEFNLPERYICTVGRPSFQKNIEMMVQVLFELKKSIEDIHLVIMGVGEYSPRKESIEKLILELGLDENVTLVNWIEREKILSIIKGSKLYISTSRYEGLPYSIIESLALGKACVVTKCDGNKDLIQTGINGYVIDQGNIREMVDKIENLYMNDEIRKNFERMSFKIFCQNYNIEKNIYLIENLYQKF